MLLLVFVAAQSAEPIVNTDNKILSQTGRCLSGSTYTNEVVVCGRRDDVSPYRLGPQLPSPPALPNAEFSLSDSTKVKLSAEQGEIGGIPYV